MSDPTEPSHYGDSRRPHRDRGSFAGMPIVGLAIIVVGLIFLARNFGLVLPLPDRWWAFFVLIPAAAGLVSAARFYRLDQRLSNRVAGAATSGVLLLAGDICRRELLVEIDGVQALAR